MEVSDLHALATSLPEKSPPVKGGPHSWLEHYTEEINLLPLPGIKPQIIQHVV